MLIFVELGFLFFLGWNSFASGRVFTADMGRHFRSSREVDNIDIQVELLTPVDLHIDSKIISRFANTLVTSVMENSSPKTREGKFVVQLPLTAFISNFSMEVNGTIYIGVVKEKGAAVKEYEKAKNLSISAGLVSSTSEAPIRGMDVFQIAMNIAPNSVVIFRLAYQQLLVRRRGYYEQTISIRPKQIVPRLQVDVDIVEPQALSFVDVMKIRKKPSDDLEAGNPTATLQNLSPSSVHIKYNPSGDEQKSQGSDQGLDGDLVVRYDVKGGDDAGLIQILGSYFVQYFSPRGLTPLPKNVVFVIDISGSMGGQKIEQTRQAMLTITGQLRVDDAFNMVIFDDVASKWRDEMVQATTENKEEGKRFVRENVKADGATNINDALLLAVKLLKATADQQNNVFARNFPMIVFLTDGQPTFGETRTSAIRLNVKRANGLKASIFTLGFGFDLDLAFLEALAIENGGIARRIYQDTDAKNQLEGFFDEVSTPVLRRLEFDYPSDIVISPLSTTTDFPQYYEGSELVVSGKIRGGVSSGSVMSVTVRGYSSLAPVTYSLAHTLQNLTLSADQVIVEDFTERLWAYLTIKTLLSKLLITDDEDDKAAIKSRALNMSLKYNFVTSLTSLVVIQSDLYDGNQQNEADASYPSDPRFNTARLEIYSMNIVFAATLMNLVIRI